MHARRVVGKIVGALKSLADVVGIEHGVFGGLAKAVRAVGLNVGQGSDEHSEVPVESANPSDGVWAVVFETKRAVFVRNDHRFREEGLENFLDRNRAGTGASPAMGR